MRRSTYQRGRKKIYNYTVSALRKGEQVVIVRKKQQQKQTNKQIKNLSKVWSN